MRKDSRIYVAGHRGLLGSALARRLKALGYTGILVTERSETDLTDRRSVEEFFRRNGPEYVFLAAGRTGGIMANRAYPAELLHENLAIQDNVFEAARRHGARNLVFYASSCIYPEAASQPIREECLFSGRLEETSGAYATAKIAGVMACKAYNAQYGTNAFIALVPNTMYGPNDDFSLENSHVLSGMMRKFRDAKFAGMPKMTLWGSGNPRRELVFSEDVADASVFAVLNAGRLANRHYNIGTGRDCSIRELAETLASSVGYKGEVEWDTSRPDGARRKLLDSTDFQSLGWKPAVSLREGVRRTWEWLSGAGAADQA